ncbi:6-hydroxy-D-nicotine oxidase OS=Arthrobacter oxidans PE=1 SV=2 [Rhizoctonia solani AG-1 IB]|uniref:6-hydroxy-D-nicotine oxidase n=1 Tax=Thanatephorus cucumeris (strain AG1-IB / isolate 7/3/14) TaxID=1108050 RepID=A0A0B7FLE4_THACB|nr:6-hydroxy-D-nicotine oxidase OS=Arthrobacter oxidans PE=1 SV=2 [Rhizoctonia solani AG-1 IB]
MTRSILLGACALAAASASVLPRENTSAGFCLADQPCFPSADVLAQFNATISGRLHSERPIGAVCYQDDPDFNQAACNDVAKNTNSSNWRIAHFPTYQYTVSEVCNPTDNCNATTPVRDRTCAQGRIPSYSVHAETADDVVKYVRFATKHNLRIVIKNTGHDLLGRSTGKGGFALWTHKMNGIQFNQTFLPEGCSKEIDGGLMTLDAGVQWGEAYKFADSVNRTIVGGGASSVGSAGGFPLGGGYSLLSPSLGLGLNNMVELELVTADGQLRRISECSNPDLFWAVRGGGGGTWGATTRVTYRTHPKADLHVLSFNALNANMSDSVVRETVLGWVKLAPTLGDLGIGGAAFLSDKSLSINVMVQSPFATLPKFKETLSPFTSWLAEQGVLGTDLESTMDGTSIYTSYAGWYDFFSRALAPDSDSLAGGAGGSLPSRLVPRHYYESNPEGLADILVDASKKSFIILGMTGPLRFVKDHPTAINTTSVTPAWYQSPWHIASYVTTPLLREFAKDGGAYFGESDIDEPNAAHAYWGSNYPALLRAKTKWDPRNVFQVWHGVGSPTLGNATQPACA